MNESNTDTFNKLLVPGSVIIAGLLIAGALLWNNKYPASIGNVPNTGNPQPAQAVDIKDISLTNAPYIGNVNAPLAIVFWADFQCPFCRAVEIGHPQIPTKPALPDIITNYVDTGKVKIVFKDLAFLGPDSQTAALYSRAVWDLYPAKYFEWRTAMYEAQDEEHGGFGDEPSIVELTRKIAGIDATKVTAAIQTKRSEYEAVIASDRTEAQSVGLTSTPSFVIGDKPLVGAQPYAAFETAIKAALAK